MKLSLVGSSLVLLLALGVAIIQIPSDVVAQSTNEGMTERHIERIRANCIDSKAILTQLHASDALLRVNQGQVYESIATQLMAPLNSRIALNRLDGGVELTIIAQNYNQNLSEFRQIYIAYEQAVSRTLRINCENQPVAFYDSVAEAREHRGELHDITQALAGDIEAFGVEFEVFAAAQNEGGSSE